MSAGHCEAGERCSCRYDSTERAACSLWQTDDSPVKVWGLIGMLPEQKPLIEKHCFGDCGKVSMAGAIVDEHLGPLWVCTEAVCPWLKKETDEPIGNTMSFGREHAVYLRLVTDTPATTKAGDGEQGATE